MRSRTVSPGIEGADRRTPLSGRDGMTQAELERELEELWTAHVAPNIPQPDNESH